MFDATEIQCFVECREKYRRTYIQNIVPQVPSIPMCFGGAIHKGIEQFWLGKKYEESMLAAYNSAGGVDQSMWSPTELTKWNELVKSIPDLLTYYFEKVEWREMTGVEKEFILPWEGFQLCGKFDHYILDAERLDWWDIKTASEIGAGWREKYRQEAIRRIQYSFYDLVLTLQYPDAIIAPPKIEVLVKPYRGKPGRYELMELEEVPQWRDRFKDQLKFWLTEMTHMRKQYSEVSPWPMSDTACSSKYGLCTFIKLCNYGDSERHLAKFKPREEHLECRKIKTTQ